MTLLYLKQGNDRGLLYGTGNFFQYLMITYDGNESEQEYICVYVSLKHTAAHLNQRKPAELQREKKKAA